MSRPRSSRMPWTSTRAGTAMQMLGRSLGTSRRSSRRWQISLAQSLTTCGRSCEHVRHSFGVRSLVANLWTRGSKKCPFSTRSWSKNGSARPRWSRSSSRWWSRRSRRWTTPPRRYRPRSTRSLRLAGAPKAPAKSDGGADELRQLMASNLSVEKCGELLE
eukprot:906011-Pyramimonas_sp.AAC.1